MTERTLKRGMVIAQGGAVFRVTDVRRDQIEIESKHGAVAWLTRREANSYAIVKGAA